MTKLVKKTTCNLMGVGKAINVRTTKNKLQPPSCECIHKAPS